MIGNLVGEHPDDANTGHGCLNCGLCRVDRKPGAGFDIEGRPVAAVTNFGRGREALEAYTVVLGEVIGIKRNASPGDIVRTGADDSTDRTDTGCDQRAVGQVADTQRHVNWFIRQTYLAVRQRQPHVDFGLFPQEFEHYGQNVALPERDRSGHMQPSAQRAVIAARLPLSRVQFPQNTPGSGDVISPFLRQGQAAAGTQYQTGSKMLFEVGDLAADRGERRLQSPCAGREAAGIDHREQH